MLFNSIEFLLFLPVVFLLYWFAFKPLRLQNLFVIAASYIFYGWWNWRFLGLIILATTTSFIGGLLLEHFRGRRRAQRWVCGANVAVSLGILGTYKYYNFFASNLSAIFASMGIDLGWVTLDLVLPVGISFYTFQTLAYTIDVYRGKIEPTRDAAAFYAFVAFFPQLVAGPIERAANLLPQFLAPRRFDYGQAVDGMRQALWGLFKKMVVADNCGVFVDHVFSNYQTVGSLNLFMGAVLFSFQIYGDFSGYTDIAIGTARLFGIELRRNFAFPYFSRSIAEFWRRWHISLTAWFRDYVYIPLGGSRHGTAVTVRNTIIVFLVSGFWHGADWTFICWGAFNALLFVPLLLAGTSRRYKGTTVAEGRSLPSAKELALMSVTFLLVVLGRILYRAESIPAAATFFRRMATEISYTYPLPEMRTGLYIALMLIVEWRHRHGQHGLAVASGGRGGLGGPPALRRTLYIILTMLIILESGQQEAFIYFQF